MRRSILLQVSVYCPHFQRPVVAERNEVTARLVHCGTNLECRENKPDDPFPRGCPVYPQLAAGGR